MTASDSRRSSLFAEEAPTTLEGEVSRVVYTDAEHGWAVIRFRDGRSRRTVTAVGYLASVQPGERLRLTGQWEQDRKYGRQFRVEAFLGLMPNTVLGIARFLGSGLIPGIGPVMAERLIERFGLQTLEIIESDPARLTEVQGIGAQRARGIREAWQQQKGVREVLIFLQSHGVGLGHATKIYREYGGRSVEVMRTNPYRLAEDIFGFGFRTADKIAMRIGIASDSPARAAAGLLHVLSRAETRGHVLLPLPELVAQASELLQLPDPTVQEALGDLVERRKVVADRSVRPEELSIYRRRLYTAERDLAARIVELSKTGSHGRGSGRNTELDRFEQQRRLRLSQRQREAVIRSLSEAVLVITGGPGTGKTTLIRAVVALTGSESRIALAAPTGRAAKRLTESTGLEAKTLHRLLEFDPRSLSFQRNRQRPLEADLVIVDETSMLDCLLAWHLSEALPGGSRLVLVGDVDQLPSVGPGRVLADLIEAGTVPVIRLEEVFRQAAASLIVDNAHRIRRGVMPRFETDPDVDFYFIERNTPDEILETIEHLITVRIPRRYHLDAKRDIQLLAPMRRGEVGIERLNREMQQLLSGDEPELEISEGRFRRGDRVMQVRNDYDLEIFNGDVGHVLQPSSDGEHLIADFYGRRILYPIADSDRLVLAYACSIHKSQGSEYPCVIIPIHSQHYLMLQRNLLYTAVTRGRKLVIVIGEHRALAQAVRNDRQQLRYTGLIERLRSSSPSLG